MIFLDAWCSTPTTMAEKGAKLTERIVSKRSVVWTNADVRCWI